MGLFESKNRNQSVLGRERKVRGGGAHVCSVERMKLSDLSKRAVSRLGWLSRL